MAFEAALGMERLCTIKEIAEKSDLSATTVHRALKGSVHRALKGSLRVRPSTRQLVVATLCQLNEEKIARAAGVRGGR